MAAASKAEQQQQPQQQQQQRRGGARQRLHSAALVRATPFYGYHSSERLWVKLLL
jgi:hypothetical protein